MFMQLGRRVLIVIVLVPVLGGIGASAETIQTFKVPKGVHLYWCGHRLTGKVKATIANDTLYLNGKGPWLAAADTMDRFVGYMIVCGPGSTTYRSHEDPWGQTFSQIVSKIHAGKSLDEVRREAPSDLIDTTQAFALRESLLTVTFVEGRTQRVPITGIALARLSDPNRHARARLRMIVGEVTKRRGKHARDCLIIANRLRTVIESGPYVETTVQAINNPGSAGGAPTGMLAEIRGVQAQQKR